MDASTFRPIYLALAKHPTLRGGPHPVVSGWDWVGNRQCGTNGGRTSQNHCGTALGVSEVVGATWLPEIAVWHRNRRVL